MASRPREAAMLEDLETIPWLTLAQPAWNAPDTIPSALRRLASSSSESQSWDAYNDVLYALGNNHAGTYFPAVLAAIPFVGQILHGGTDWARLGALDILIELTASFEPEAGFETVTTPAGETADLRLLLRQEVARYLPFIRALATADTTGEEERRRAIELLSCFAEMK